MFSAQMLAQAELFAWYNAVFVVLFGVGLFFTFLQLLGLSQDSGVDAGADVDGDIDVDAHVEVDAHVDADAGVDAHVDGDVGADAGMDADADAHAPAVGHHSAGLGGTVGQLLGLGKVPLSISLMLLCYTMGVAGWASNEILSRHVQQPAAFFPLSLLVALIAAFAVLRVASMLMSRYLPTVATSALNRKQLVGLTAKAVLPINDKFGRACLYDKFGTLHVVGCKTREGNTAIEKGAEVVLIKYVPERDLYIVGRA